MRFNNFIVLACLSLSGFEAYASFNELSMQVFPKKAPRERRIMNGIPAAPHQFPYQVITLIVGNL